MEMTIYKPVMISKIDEMSYYTPAINELQEKHGNEVKKVLYMVIMKYVAAYDIERVKINDTGIEILVEQILAEHGNLEIQEIEFALKKGIVGAYGTIYGDLRIDTIFGWLTKYKDEDRARRPEPKQEEPIHEITGEEITLEEYYLRYPDEKQKYMLADILNDAKQGRLKLDDVKTFYKIKGLTLDDLKEDMEVLSARYQNVDSKYKEAVSEMQYILMWAAGFIKKSWNKKIN